MALRLHGHAPRAVAPAAAARYQGMEPYVHEISSVLASLGPEIDDAALALALAAHAWLDERAKAMGQEQADEADRQELAGALIAALKRARTQ